MGKWNRGGRIAADIKVIQIPETGESKILDVGIRNLAQGIRNPTNDWNPESKFHWQRIRNPES